MNCVPMKERKKFSKEEKVRIVQEAATRRSTPHQKDLQRYSSLSEEQGTRTEERRIAYLTFMDDAFEKFDNTDHKECLEDIRCVQQQYPDDANALFYAGLCSYNLGMNSRAETLLAQAATHPIRVFDEKAEWYNALALERLGRNAEARTAFTRIAAAPHFYQDRAKQKLVVR